MINVLLEQGSDRRKRTHAVKISSRRRHIPALDIVRGPTTTTVIFCVGAWTRHGEIKVSFSQYTRSSDIFGSIFGHRMYPLCCREIANIERTNITALNHPQKKNKHQNTLSATGKCVARTNTNVTTMNIWNTLYNNNPMSKRGRQLTPRRFAPAPMLPLTLRQGTAIVHALIGLNLGTLVLVLRHRPQHGIRPPEQTCPDAFRA